MSIHVTATVWSVGPENPIHRFVLLKLADNANDSGVAWPSKKRIIAQTKLSKATVNRSLRALIADGWISVSRRGGGLAPAVDRGNPQKYDPDCDGVSPLYQFGDRIMSIVRARLGHGERKNGKSLPVKGAQRDNPGDVTKGVRMSHPHTPNKVEPSTEPSPTAGTGATLPEKDNPGLAADIVASAVLSQCSIVGDDLRGPIKEIARSHIEAGTDAFDLVRRMVEAHQRWMRAVAEDKLRFAWSVERFFKEDWWSDSNRWPWRIGINRTTAKARMIFE